MNPDPLVEQSPARFVRGLLRRSLLLTLLAALASAALGAMPWAKGLALGGLASAANLFLMAWLLPRSLGASRRRAEAVSLGSFLGRLVPMGLAVWLALEAGAAVALPACIIGLFAVQITIFLDRFLGRHYPASLA